MQEVTDHDVGAKILLPRGDHMIIGHVMAQSHDADVNVVGRAHANPILDTVNYQVEFAGSEVTELTAKIISELMYAQCDADGNDYLLLGLPIDHHKDDKAISFTDQQTSIQGRPVTHKSMLPVEQWFYLMAEVLKVKRISSSSDS